MKKLIPIFLCTLMAACNFPTADEGISLNEQAGTAVALTMAAETSETTDTSEPPKDNTLPAPSSTVEGTPSPTITPTYSVPMLTVNENTNCRSGPGQSYDILVTIMAGKSVEIVGKHENETYWVVNVDGLDDPCWIWGEFSTTTGSYWTVPVMTPPATQAPSPASQPTNLNYTYFCTYNGTNSDVTVTLSWNDPSDNELGFRIYRDDTMVTELPPNSKKFSENITADSTDTISYSVTSFNAVGESSRASISFSCQ